MPFWNSPSISAQYLAAHTKGQTSPKPHPPPGPIHVRQTAAQKLRPHPPAGRHQSLAPGLQSTVQEGYPTLQWVHSHHISESQSHRQAAIIPGMQGWFNTHRFVKLTYHINKMKNKNLIIISIYV